MDASKLFDANLTPGERESRAIFTNPDTESGRCYSAWLIEQRAHEITRLQAILRNPTATLEEKRVAEDMLKQYKVST